MPSKIQAIIFAIKNFPKSEDAREWLRKHKYKPIKRVHRTKKFLRYRLAEPNNKKQHRTHKIKEGIKMIIEY
jgi:hypothetical protein